MEIRKKFDGNILVFNINEQNGKSNIDDQFKQYLDNNPIKKVTLLETKSILTDKDYFKIDDHLNAKGHKTIAKYLKYYISENGLIEN